MQAVYEFQNYRDYLKSFYVERKKSVPGYSYRAFSQVAGLGSPNYLKLVIDGDRNLTVSNIHQFSRALGLTADETDYFEALVLHNQGGTREEKRFYKERLEKVRSRKSRRSARVKLNEVIGKWYLPAVLLALEGKPAAATTTEAAAGAARMIGITPAQAARAIETLLRHELLRVEEGTYKLAQDLWIYHDPAERNAIQREFLRAQLERSITAFNTRYGKEAKFYAHTFTISADAFQKYGDRIRAFLEDLAAASDQEKPEKLAQLNVQLFSLTGQP